MVSRVNISFTRHLEVREFNSFLFHLVSINVIIYGFNTQSMNGLSINIIHFQCVSIGPLSFRRAFTNGGGGGGNNINMYPTFFVLELSLR